MTDCSMCGLCCEDISIQNSPDQMTQLLIDRGYTCDDPMDYAYNVDFVLDNWIYNGPDKRNGHQYQCAQFDTETRTCMAHESRPRVCRDYPWYRDTADQLIKYESGRWLQPQCSFNADVRTMLPIVEVKHAPEQPLDKEVPSL